MGAKAALYALMGVSPSSLIWEARPYFFLLYFAIGGMHGTRIRNLLRDRQTLQPVKLAPHYKLAVIRKIEFRFPIRQTGVITFIRYD